MPLYFVFFGIFLFSFISFLGALWVFPKIGLLDFPERYGLSRPRLPYPGGILFVFFALLITFFVPGILWLFALLLCLGAISFLDDEFRLPVLVRLFLHLILAGFVFWAGIQIDSVGNPFRFGESFDLSDSFFLSLFLTVLWIFVIQNAMNWFDGIRGLSVGVSGIGFLALGIFGLLRKELYWEQDLEVFLTLCFYLFAVCAGGFLFFWKGKIILGDTGSQVLGFLLAVLSIFAGTKIATTLLVLGLPLFDSVIVVFRRIFIDKKSPFNGDLNHLPHLLSRKLGEEKTSILLIFLTALFGSIAIFLSGWQKILAVFVVFVFLIFLTIWSWDERQ